MGSAGPQRGAPERSGQRRTSTGEGAGPQPPKEKARRYVRKNVRKNASKNMRINISKDMPERWRCPWQHKAGEDDGEDAEKAGRESRTRKQDEKKKKRKRKRKTDLIKSNSTTPT